MAEAIFQALITPPFILAQMVVVSFQWPAAIVFSALIALVVAGLLALNHGTKSPRWIFLPVLLAHLQVLANLLIGPLAWWPVAILMLASIGWLVWVCRSVLVAGFLFGWFCLVYGGATAVYIYLSTQPAA